MMFNFSTWLPEVLTDKLYLSRDLIAGITIAMVGGRIAGQVIAEHLKDGTPLREYEFRWKQQMGKVMRNSKRSFRFGSLLFRLPDWMLNLLFNRLTKGIIWRAVTCRRMLWII